MGLSSSQARLLNLTSRMHQIEYKAAKLEAEKLQMANESTRVYEEYLEALEKTKVQYKVLTTDGSVTYQDIAGYNDFLAAGYALNCDGVTYDANMVRVVDNTNKSYSYVETVTPTSEETKTDGKYANLTPNKTYYVYNDGTTNYYSTTKLTTESNSATFYEIGNATPNNLTLDTTLAKNGFDELLVKLGIDKVSGNFENVITNIINSGQVTIVAARADNTFASESDLDFINYETSISTNTGLQEVSDEINLKKAEAKYEADMKKIDNKDRKYDSDLAALDTERNAIKSEMETLKSVAKENVERTFKLFS